MILGALIDAGADLEFIQKQIEKIDLGQVSLTTETVNKRGLRATKVNVAGTSGSAPAYRTAQRLIEDAGLDDSIEALSVAVLERLAIAEARVHGVDVDDVHFHELSSHDTIVDIVGTASAFSCLGIESATASEVGTGSGSVMTQHGLLPIPAPAVVELLKGVPIKATDIDGELSTPTGAAILVESCSSFGKMPDMTLQASGYGAGTYDFEIPNVLRVLVGQPAQQSAPAVEHVQCEANIDDMNPEFYEYVIEQLYREGAQDVWLVPCIGKRGRPAAVMGVVAPVSAETAIRQVLVAETSTLGVRTTRVQKWALEREWTDVVVAGQSIRVKIARDGGRIVNVSPEYSDCASAARRTGLPLKQIFGQALSEASGH